MSASEIPKQLDELMFDKVMTLTDIEICQQLAEIKGLSFYVQFDSIRIAVADGDDFYFDPLNNNDQLNDLTQEFEVERRYMPYDQIGWSYHALNGKNPIHITERQNFMEGENRSDLSMAKAICLAIILNRHPKYQIE